VAGDERLRLFCALRLPAAVVARLAAWQHAELHGGRIVAPENLHVTLAFLGHRPAGDLPAVVSALRTGARGTQRVRLRVHGYRETRSVGMLTLDDDGGRATGLAGRLHDALESAGVYRREARAWLPHLTVLRFRERPRLRPPIPELGEILPSDAAVFMSRLGPGGARYEVLETVPLGGR
jgi:2'-5' RNA ligase